MWAMACPPAGTVTDVEGGARSRAAAAAKAGNPQATLLALAYNGVSAEIGATAQRFESGLAIDEVDRRTVTAAERRSEVLAGPDGTTRIQGGENPPHTHTGLSQLAVLSRADIKERRLLLHANLAKGNDEELDKGGRVDGHIGGGSIKEPPGAGNVQLFPEAVQLAAEQVRGILSAKPAAVAIVSEMLPKAATAELVLPPPPEAILSADEKDPTPSTSPYPSLRATAAEISSLLGMEVEFYESVPELAKALGECNDAADVDGDDYRAAAGGGGSPFVFGPRVMLAEGLSVPGVVPAPPRQEPELSDGEEERLPDFSWGGPGKCTFT